MVNATLKQNNCRLRKVESFSTFTISKGTAVEGDRADLEVDLL